MGNSLVKLKYDFKFGPVVQEEMSFFLEKSIFSSDGHFVWRTRTVCAVFAVVEGILGKVHVKRNWTSDPGGVI